MASIRDAQDLNVRLTKDVPLKQLNSSSDDEVKRYQLVVKRNQSALILPAPGKGNTQAYNGRAFVVQFDLYVNIAGSWQVIEKGYSNLFVAHTPQIRDKHRTATIEGIVADLKKKELDFQQRVRAPPQPFFVAPPPTIDEVMFGGFGQ